MDRGELPSGSRERLTAVLSRFDSVLGVLDRPEESVDAAVEDAMSRLHQDQVASYIYT